jgi:uncharacterized OB-fold protein
MSKPRQKVILSPNINAVLVEKLFQKNVPKDVIVRENPRTITHYHTYGGLSPFYQGLTKGKLMGTICVQEGCEETGIWLPPRVHCPDCWEEMDWEEIDTSQSKIYSYSMTNYPGAGFKLTTPCPLISIEIPGVCTEFMSYLSEFGEGEPCIGMPVHPVFRTENPTYSILDVSWVPVD